MRRIRGIVRTVMAIAGAISLNSPVMGMVTTGLQQECSSHADGATGKIGSALAGMDQGLTVRGRIGKFEKRDVRMTSGRESSSSM